MKLLDWVHHKFRQTSSEHQTKCPRGNSRAYLTGQPSLDDLQYYPKSYYYASKPSSNTQRGSQLRKSFACMESASADEDEPMGEEALYEHFHGFLAIGTLGNEPATPTLAATVENIMGKETEATENELKLINEELEKVLDGCNDSSGSGRNSYASGGRSSTITLSGKPLEAAASNEAACPLQGYLFGAAVGLPETTGKKEHRASLGELFQKAKMVEEKTGSKCNGGVKEKENDKSSARLVKKIVKGRKLHSSSQHSTTASASTDKKLHKIKQMFHRKVHPEAPANANQSKYATKGNLGNEKYKNRNQMLAEDIIIFPKKDNSKKSRNRTKSSIMKPDSDGNRECWIKSDADYLVLELQKAKNETWAVSLG